MFLMTIFNYFNLLSKKINILDLNLIVNSFICFIKWNIRVNQINVKFIKQAVNIKYLFNKNKIIKNYNSIKFNIYKQRLNFNLEDIYNFYRF